MPDFQGFELDVRPGNVAGSTVISAKGPLVLEHLFKFQEASRATGSEVLVFDLSQVSYMDSSMIGSWVNAHVHLSRHGRQMALAAVPDRVKQILAVTKVDTLFRFYSTVGETEQSLPPDIMQAR